MAMFDGDCCYKNEIVSAWVCLNEITTSLKCHHGVRLLRVIAYLQTSTAADTGLFPLSTCRSPFMFNSYHYYEYFFIRTISSVKMNFILSCHFSIGSMRFLLRFGYEIYFLCRYIQVSAKKINMNNTETHKTLRKNRHLMMSIRLVCVCIMVNNTGCHHPILLRRLYSEHWIMARKKSLRRNHFDTKKKPQI